MIPRAGLNPMNFWSPLSTRRCHRKTTGVFRRCTMFPLTLPRDLLVDKGPTKLEPKRLSQVSRRDKATDRAKISEILALVSGSKLFPETETLVPDARVTLARQKLARQAHIDVQLSNAQAIRKLPSSASLIHELALFCTKCKASPRPCNKLTFSW